MAGSGRASVHGTGGPCHGGRASVSAAAHQLSGSGPFEAAASLGPVKDEAPADIKDLAQARAAARVDRDWPEADRLRAEIEAAGWKVVDQGTHYRLERAALLTSSRVNGSGYGRSASVPSRLAEPTTAPATVVTPVAGRPGRSGSRCSTAFAATSRPGPRSSSSRIARTRPRSTPSTQPEVRPASRSAGEPAEVVWTVEQLGLAAATNAGIRRATGEVVDPARPAASSSPATRSARWSARWPTRRSRRRGLGSRLRRSAPLGGRAARATWT